MLRVATLSAATESGTEASAIVPAGGPGTSATATEPDALPRSETTFTLAGPTVVPARTCPESVPPDAAVHWNPGVPRSSSVTTVSPAPVTVKRSPSATGLENTSRTARDVTWDASTPSATSVPGAAASAIAPEGAPG